MNKVEVCYSPASFPLFYNENAIVVVIDVLRATSAICTALYHGVEKIIPVADLEDARAYQKQGFITAAERNGEVIEGFDLGNSPFDYMNDAIKGKTIVLSTTNGTQAIEAAKNNYQVVIGSFLNKDVLSEWLIKQKRDIVFLCAGWKNKFNLEDTLLAGAITQNLLRSKQYETVCDSAIASMHLYTIGKNNLYTFLENSSHRLRLDKLKLEKDIKYCFTPNLASVIPILVEKKYLMKI